MFVNYKQLQYSTMGHECKHQWTKGTKQYTATVIPTDAQGQEHVLTTMDSKKYGTKLVQDIFY